MEVLAKYIDPDSYICANLWRGYVIRGDHFSGHDRINKSENFVNPSKEESPKWRPPNRLHDHCVNRNWEGQFPESRIHTQSVERCWEDLKVHLENNNNSGMVEQYLGEDTCVEKHFE